MKNIFFKVNRRCALLSLLVVFLFINTQLNAQTSTPVPANAYQNPLQGFMQFMFPGQPETVPQSQIPTAIPGTGTPTVTPVGGIPTSPGLIPTSIPVAIPAQCQTKLNSAMANMTTHQNNINFIYIPTEMATGVSWEIVATLHYLETGGSLDPNYSVLTGARIGTIETVIDTGICAPGSTNPLSQYTIRITAGANTGCGFDNVIKSALYAATLFKDKYSMARTLNSRNGFDISTDEDFKLLVGALASYNGFTQGECEISTSTLLYSGNRWDSVIPNRNQCKPKYAGEDHVYGLYCLTDYYTNMYFHYHFGGSVIPYDAQGRVGGIAFIHALQEKYSAPPQTTPTPTPPSAGTYTPIVVSGLTYYPQCSSPAIPGAYWSNRTMPGCGTYCGYGCGIASSAMIYSSLSGDRKDPEQFMNLYTQSGSPNCLIDYSILRNLFSTHNIVTGTPLVLPSAKSLFSPEGSALVDGYLQSGQTVLVMGTISSYNHFVWIVGKENGRYNVMDPYWSAPSSGTSPTFPIIPYTSNRYSMFMIKSMLPVRQQI